MNSDVLSALRREVLGIGLAWSECKYCIVGSIKPCKQSSTCPKDQMGSVEEENLLHQLRQCTRMQRQAWQSIHSCECGLKLASITLTNSIYIYISIRTKQLLYSSINANVHCLCYSLFSACLSLANSSYAGQCYSLKPCIDRLCL